MEPTDFEFINHKDIEEHDGTIIRKTNEKEEEIENEGGVNEEEIQHEEKTKREEIENEEKTDEDQEEEHQEQTNQEEIETEEKTNEDQEEEQKENIEYNDDSDIVFKILQNNKYDQDKACIGLFFVTSVIMTILYNTCSCSV